jgi:hypothetical protein
MTKLCPRGKAAAKKKFKVYPSAYANAYASRICAGKIKDPSGIKRKDWGPKSMKEGSMVKVKKFSGGALTSTEPNNAQGPILPEEEGFLRGVSPYIEKSGEGQEGSFSKISRDRAGVDFDTKIGNIGLGISKATTSNVGGPDFIQKNIGATYNKQLPLGESSTVDLYGGYGKQSSQVQGYDDSKKNMNTYNVGARYSYRFGGNKEKGGMVNEGRFKYVKGGFEEGNYQDYVDELIK